VRTDTLDITPELASRQRKGRFLLFLGSLAYYLACGGNKPLEQPLNAV